MTVASDTALLSAVLKAAIAEPGRGEIRVDPRPFNSDVRLYTTGSDAVVAIPDSVLGHRIAVINAFGLATVDATLIGQNSRCPGVFVGIPDHPVAEDSVHAGCPSTRFYVLAIGLPRVGTARLVNGDVYDRENLQAASGYWAVRVIRTNMTPAGSSLHASDYILKNADSKWTVVKIVGVMYTE